MAHRIAAFPTTLSDLWDENSRVGSSGATRTGRRFGTKLWLSANYATLAIHLGRGNVRLESPVGECPFPQTSKLRCPADVCTRDGTVITVRVSRRRREMYCGHERLCVCLSVRGRMPTLLHGPGCNLGEW